MITTLLDKRIVMRDETHPGEEGTLCAVYQDGLDVLFGVILDDGKLLFNLAYTEFDIVSPRVDNSTNYKVLVPWTPDRKINAIKIRREVAQEGLKEAKDWVEAANPFVLKDNMSKAEADALARRVEQEGFHPKISQG